MSHISESDKSKDGASNQHGAHPNYQHAPWYTAFFRKGHLLVLSIVIILVAGLSAIQSLPRLEDPRIDLRNVIVLTSFPGASAERVEALVTDVIEDELRQLFEIKEIKSTSKAGFSSLSVELQDTVDNSNNQQIFSKIRDALDDAAARFPPGAQAPILEDKRGATAFTVLYALSPVFEENTDLSLTSRMADELADSLRNVPGTELVRIYGEPQEEITVTLNAQQLALAGMSLSQVSQRIAAADAKLPAGVLLNDARNIRVQVAQPLESVSIVANTPIINNSGDVLRLGDISDVQRTQLDPPTEIALVNGKRSIFVAVRMQTTVRVDTWTQAIKKQADKFNQSFGSSVKAELVFEQNKYTDQRLSELSNNLLLGSVVVMFVVLFFMGAKAAWIVGLALPMCAAFAIFSLSFFNQQIHQMSIFGIIIAIGLLIDNAIVITDEIRLNLLNHSLSRLDVLQKSVKHLFSPLLASTLTTILGFMPVFLLNGNIGDFIGGIAISVVMALIGSLAISLTIIAALAARFLPRDSSEDHAWYRRGYQLPSVSKAFERLLAKLINRPMFVLPAIAVFCASGFVLSTTLENVFFPSADRDQFEMYVFMPSGTGINRTYEMTREIDEHLRQNEKIEQLTWLVGASTPSIYYNQVMTRDNSPEFANAVFTTSSVADADTLVRNMHFDVQNRFPEAKIVVRKFGQGPPIASPLEVDIFGPDLEVLEQLGQQVRLAMTKIEGLTQSTASITMTEAELNYAVSEEVSYLSQLSLNEIAEQLQNALAGSTGGSILQGTEEMPIRVRINNAQRSSLSELEALPLISRQVQQTGPLGVANLGSFSLQPSISGITRLDGERINKVQAYLLPGVAAVSASNQLRDELEQGALVLPEGYRIKMAGDADEQQQALGQLATYAPVLLVLMITSLILSFSSVRFAAVIAVVAMLSVGLGFFSLWLSGLPVGFNPLLGSAGLIGVAINGSIVVIASIASNTDAMRGDTEAIVSETMSCSRHILSTTFTTVGGLIPLLLFSEGSFWPPLAVVIAGGVGFSVILSLIFTPTIVSALCRLREKRKAFFAKQLAN
ncbi:efflux RND transporter permease subunit [Ningiella sp. W23]|uniref:efflux RND transporter permease subunit n=1 Tax=Ningiella sp. W23 TaxID=3023715 RepID=UPI003756FDDE